jgi:primosomal protein N' (replication factor Y)
MIARITVAAAVDRLFDYVVPDVLRAQVVPGMRVRVPFGPRTVTGYVVEVVEQPDPPDPAAQTDLLGERIAPTRALKSIEGIVGEHPFLTEPLLKLLQWLAGYYGASLEAAIRSALPAPVRAEGARAKEQLFVDLPDRTDQSDQTDQPDPKLTPRQAEILAQIRQVGGGWASTVCREFHCTPEMLRKLAAAGVITLAARAMRRNPMANRAVLPTLPLALMPEQATALAQVQALCDDPSPRPLLLLGVTNSGKTEVYLQGIAHVLAQGRGAIVLVPEIALTPQTVQRFAGRFGPQVAVLHSALSDGERYDEWHRIRTGEARVVVGPRSAVFAPVTRLGLIVVDEEHEPSYKQDEAPRYNARDVAVMRGRMEQSAVILGSATPAMETWYNAQRGKYHLARMLCRVDNRPRPSVRVVDMRIEMAKAGHVQVFSSALLDAIQNRLSVGEQVILFLNRRGYATSLQCPCCGYVATCEACAVAFTYHQTDTCLRCHTCGDFRQVPAVCPGCQDPAFKYVGFGTQRVEMILNKCCPQARVARMDADVTARRHSHDEILDTFRRGRADILLGTQMIAKGLHFPSVTLVGVLAADMSLHMPDFRAGERTFQLLAQVSGRAGRGDIPGEVIIQTYTPRHPAVVAAETADFEAFAAGEMAERRRGGFPPYTRMVCLTLRGGSEEKVAFVAAKLAERLKALAHHQGAGQEGGARPAATGLAPGVVVDVSDALPAPRAKAKGEFRYQILLRAVAMASIHPLLHQAVGEARLPADVALALDVDALSIL